MRVKWAPGEVCNTGGDDYLVPFNENSGSWFKSFSFSSTKAAPKKQEAKKEETKKEEKKENVVQNTFFEIFDSFKF